MEFDAAGAAAPVIRAAHQFVIATSSTWAYVLVFFQTFAIVWFMLGLEVFEVVLVMRVILRLLVLGKLGVVTIFH